MDDILYTDESVVVSSPTGSGKTVLFEFGIIHLLEQIQSSQQKCDCKILYMAPLKALCTERLLDWDRRFSSLGLKCIELTGDSDISELHCAYSYQIILTTPEKWDSLTRKWRDHENFIKSVKLFLIDEAHILNEEKRGATLEAVVSRMKLLNQNRSSSKNEQHIRFIAVSATITNIQDIALWLGRTPNSPAIFKKLGDDMRPVNLHKVVKGYTFRNKQTQYQFDINLSYKIKEILFEYSEGKPTLIFCSTRNGVQQTSNVLFKELSFSFTEEQNQKLIEASSKLIDTKLSELIMSGIGYHHAGMLLNDKNQVVELFRSGYLPILVATSTLAMGVNLPAHLVIVKSTQHYVDGTFKEYSEVQLLQMIGRAGRPQYDTSATAVIMTTETNKAKYEQLITGIELIESSLHRHLAEYLNAEIVLRTITDIPIAMDWIRSTFFYIRASANPKHYGISSGLSKEAFEGKLQDMCMRELNNLVRNNLVVVKNGYDIQANENGTLMAQYCISLETMKIFMQLKGTESLEDMVNLLSHAYEFSDINLRVNEKSALNYMNKNNSGGSIRFPLKGRITTKFMKINCLIQSILSCLPINDTSLNQDAVRIIRVSQRLMRAFSRYIWRQPYFKSLVSSTVLTKCLECKLWENSPYIVRQLPGIGPALASLLVAAGKTTFRKIVDANPRDLERILNRHPPFGNHLQESVWRIPQYNLEMALISPETIRVNVKLINADDTRLDEECNKQKITLLIVGIDKKVVLHLPQQNKISGHNQKEDSVGIKLNSLQINRPTSGETKTKCSLDLKYFSFTPRKSIQHSTSNLSTFDSNIRKTNNELNNSTLSKKPVACSQQHRSGDVSEDKDSNFVDIDDLLKSNFTERTLVPKTKKLTCLPASNVYIQSKKSVSFHFKNTNSSCKTNLNLKNVLPESSKKLFEKQHAIFTRNKTETLTCSSILPYDQDLQSESKLNLQNIVPASPHKRLEEQHGVCVGNVNQNHTQLSKLSSEQRFLTGPQSFLHMKTILPVSADKLFQNRHKISSMNGNKNLIRPSKLSCKGDLETETALSQKSVLSGLTNNFLEDWRKTYTENLKKNSINHLKLSCKEDMETEIPLSQKDVMPGFTNKLSEDQHKICLRNANKNLIHASKLSREKGLNTQTEENPLTAFPNDLMGHQHKMCAENVKVYSINPSKLLCEQDLKTQRTLSEKNLLPTFAQNKFKAQHNIFARNTTKNIMCRKRLSFEEDFKTETIHRENISLPLSESKKLKSPEKINDMNKSTHPTSSSKQSSSHKVPLQVPTNKLLKSPYKIDTSDKKSSFICPTDSLSEGELKTEDITDMNQSKYNLEATKCSNLIPENISKYSQSSNNSQIQSSQQKQKNTYHPMFLSLNEICDDEEHKVIDTALTTLSTSNVIDCDKQEQGRCKLEDNTEIDKNKKNDSSNHVECSRDNNSNVLDKKHDNCKPCVNDIEKQKIITSCNDVSKDNTVSNHLNKIEVQEKMISRDYLNGKNESEEDYSSDTDLFKENNSCNDITAEERNSNDTDVQVQERNISCDLLNQNKTHRENLLSGIYKNFSDLNTVNINLNKTSRNVEDITQAENRNRKESDTLLHQSFVTYENKDTVNIIQEKCLSQSRMQLVTSTTRTKLNRKYKLDVQKSFFQTNNADVLKDKINGTPRSDRVETDGKNHYNTKNIILPSQFKTNGLTSTKATKSFMFHSQPVSGMSEQMGQQIMHHVTDVSDLDGTEDVCSLSSNITNSVGEKSVLHTADKSQKSSIIQRHFKNMLKDSPFLNNDTCINQKKAFQQLYGDVKSKESKGQISKNTSDLYSIPLFSSCTQPPNSISRRNGEKEVQKSEHWFTDQSNQLLDEGFNLSQFNSKRHKNFEENGHKNNDTSNTKNMPETINSNQNFNWFCGNNFDNDEVLNLGEKVAKINKQWTVDNVFKNAFGEFCKEPASSDTKSKYYDLFKADQDSIKYEIPKKKIKFEISDNLSSERFGMHHYNKPMM